MEKGRLKPKKVIDTKWSSNLAYAIGLLATDGCLVKHSTLIDLTSNDREQLLNFNKCIGINLKIGFKNSGSNHKSLRVQIKNRKFYDFLLSINLTPAKSKTISEVKIPDKYFFDFLRGCFDGDGCFYSYWDKRWRSSFMFYTEFASASPKFILWLQDKVFKKIGIRGHVTNDRKGSTQQLKYAKSDSIKLLEHMYHSSNVVCLSRKRLKIAKVFDKIGLSVRYITCSA
jgi:intein-encoded DNA endonuclease-like protein